MITSLDINWYKPFTRLSIDHLTPVTIIGGRNNTGKTALLEAIFILFDRTSPQFLLRSMAWRGFSQLKGPADRIFAHAFHDYNIENEIGIEATYRGTTCKLSLSYKRPKGPPSAGIEEAEGLGPSSSGEDSARRRGSADIIHLRYSEDAQAEEADLYIDGDTIKF